MELCWSNAKMMMLLCVSIKWLVLGQISTPATYLLNCGLANLVVLPQM
jgi:hypothetical protein